MDECLSSAYKILELKGHSTDFKWQSQLLIIVDPTQPVKTERSLWLWRRYHIGNLTLGLDSTDLYQKVCQNCNCETHVLIYSTLC